jgi:ABC-2 type transport system permease protein
VKLLAFLLRDARLAMSYRLQFALSVGQVLVTILLFFFIGKTFGGTISPLLGDYGGNYFSYALVGIAVSVFVSVGLDALSRQIREAQLEGTLEALLGTPTSIYTILLGNSLFRCMSAMVVAVAILAYGMLSVQYQTTPLGALAGFLVLLLTFGAFLCVGMLSASFIMIFKQGNPIGFLFGTSSYFLGGVLFPVEVLPRPFRAVSQALPTTHAVKALRELLLAHAAFPVVLPLVGKLLVFIAVVAPLSILFFRFAVARAKRDGTLVHY